MTARRDFPAEPARHALRRLATRDDLTVTATAERLGIDRDTLHRLAHRDTLRWDAADRIAIALGRHPSELWPEWWTPANQPLRRIPGGGAVARSAGHLDAC